MLRKVTTADTKIARKSFDMMLIRRLLKTKRSYGKKLKRNKEKQEQA